MKEPFNIHNTLLLYKLFNFKILKSNELYDDSELDIVFDKNFKIIYWKPNPLSVSLLSNFEQFKKKSNISYILGIRYLIMS